MNVKYSTATLVFIAISYTSAMAQGAPQAGKNEIEVLIDKLESEVVAQERYKLVEALAVNMAELSPANRGNAVTTESIDRIARLLRDPEPLVRYWAALALGNAGSEAVRIIPELERALHEEDLLERQSTSIFGPRSVASAMRAAIRRIAAAQANSQELCMQRCDSK